MEIVGIIPARMDSTRLQGKPLAEIQGVPMVGHVFFRSKMSKILNQVYIATCDQEIRNYAESIGAPVIMTSIKHERASDRTAEAMLKIEAEKKEKLDIVVMIQGDEPMVLPQMIDLAVEPFLTNSEILVSNLMAPLRSQKEHEDPNEIKVVVDTQNNALYFSREPIPTRKKGIQNGPMFKQVCIIPFQRDFLLKFNEMEMTPLEKSESIDMLRVLEHGFDVKMIYSEYKTYSVDTKEDLSLVAELMKGDSLVAEYRYMRKT